MFNPAEALRDNPALFACYVLYIYFRGRNAVRIEREMRSLGHHTFHRRNLYPRGKQPGWIAKYNWQGQSKDEGERIMDKAGEPGSASSFIPHPSSFESWLKRVSPNMTWDWRHQQVIIEQLKKVTDGDCKRLMIFLPPRHGKSELVSVRYTAWRMQQQPSMSVILGSYNQRLADRMSRKIRTVVCDAEQMRIAECGSRNEERIGSTAVERKAPKTEPSISTANIPQSAFRSPHSETPQSPFPFSRPRPKNAVSEWETATGGSFRAVGAGSGVTGFGANLIVIDDPVKNRAQAESETYRNRVWDWYKDDLYTRLEPDGSIVLIQTRWHEDDLAGRLLRDDLDNWTIINLPALSEPGAIATGLPSEPRAIATDGFLSEPQAIATGFLSEPPASAGGQIAAQEQPQIDADERRSMSVPPAVAGGCSQPIETESIEINSTDLSQEGRFTPALHPSQPSGGKPAFPTEKSSLESEIVHSPLSTLNSFEWRDAPNIALCPERFDIAALDKLKTQLGTYSFSALYQQRPTPAGGMIFKREWFKQIIDFAPPGLKWKRGYDLAVSTRTESDYTASFRCAFDKEGNLYIAGGFRRRIEFPEQRRYIIDRMLNERDTEHGVELALHGQALIQELRRDPSIRGKSLSGVKVSTDKLTRALTWSPLAEEGKVILIRNAEFGMRNENPAPGRNATVKARANEPCDTEISPRPPKRQKNEPDAFSEIPHSEFRIPHSPWIDDLLDELTAFPNGTHDDQVDAISLTVQMLAAKPRRAVGMLIT